VVVGEALPDRGGADGRGFADHRVDVGVQAVQGCGSQWIFFRSGGSAEASARVMVRWPVCCLAMMSRWVKPFSVSRRMAAYFFRLASRLVLRLVSSRWRCPVTGLGAADASSGKARRIV
jgi:hypothetical protein